MEDKGFNLFFAISGILGVIFTSSIIFLIFVVSLKILNGEPIIVSGC